MTKRNEITDTMWSEIRQKRAVRIMTASESFNWFFHLYLAHYVQYPTADFQRELMTLAEDPSVEQLVVMAFRESGKSTILTTALPVWAVVGKPQKKYVLIVSQTQTQAQQHLANIAHELDTNELIRKDFWPYDYESNELGVTAINLKKFGARIIAVSKEQGVRGLRHGAHRPDLIIADDVEDSRTVAQQDARDKNFAWFTGELIPLGSETTKLIVVGNQIHEDSLINRLRLSIESGERDGVYCEYPIVRDDVPLWPGRFPNETAIEKLRRKIADPVRFAREYELRIVPDGGQILTREDIHYYSELPTLPRNAFQRIRIGVDLAICQEERSDYTAMVTFEVRGTGDSLRIYVLPHPINQQLNFTETVDLLVQINGVHRYARFYVESTGYQQAVVDYLEHRDIDVEGVKPLVDKYTRLNLASDSIRRGTVLFPEQGCEKLIAQIVNFGPERHKDLADALTVAVLEILREPGIATAVVIKGSPYDRVKVLPQRTQKRGRDYWSERLDDWDEATSDKWDSGSTRRLL